MTEGSGRRRDGDYHLSRIAIAILLTALVIFLEVRDAMDQSYAVDLQTLIALLFAILGLLGLEARDILRRDADK